VISEDVKGVIDERESTYIFKESESDTCAEEFAEMFHGKLAKNLENMPFYVISIFLWIVGDDGDDHGRKVGAVYGIMYGDRDLVSAVVVYKTASDASPHRLKKIRRINKWGNGERTEDVQ